MKRKIITVLAVLCVMNFTACGEMDEYEEDREEQIDEREYFDVTFNIESEC